ALISHSATYGGLWAQISSYRAAASPNVAALLRPIAGRGAGGLREGELHKPDLITYIVMCLLLFLLVLLIVFFINCQLRNSFFASMPYDRSLREARTSYNVTDQMLPTCSTAPSPKRVLQMMGVGGIWAHCRWQNNSRL
uniref:Small integral membrane protein 32 n=1 Tax=Sander lucioperca TaxID=283035 RepID=A0A8D0CQY9_SANLU